MSKVEIEIDEHVLNQARAFAAKHQYNLEDLIAKILTQISKTTNGDSIIGLFSDEPELLDQISKEALATRDQF